MEHRLHFLGEMEVQMITLLDQMSLGRESPQVSYEHKE
jgi:hypothetical protein